VSVSEYVAGEFANPDYATLIVVGKTLTSLYNTVSFSSPVNYWSQNYLDTNYLAGASFTIGKTLRNLYNSQIYSGKTETFNYHLTYFLGLGLRSLYTSIGHTIADINLNYNLLQHLGAANIHKYHIKFLTLGKTLLSGFDIRSNRPVPTSDAAYIRPLKPKIIISSKDGVSTYHIYDSFHPELSDIKVLECHVRLGEGQTGEFSVSIEDNLGLIDRSKVGNGNRVQISCG
jgi:hypothetical protein